MAHASGTNGRGFVGHLEDNARRNQIRTDLNDYEKEDYPPPLPSNPIISWIMAHWVNSATRPHFEDFLRDLRDLREAVARVKQRAEGLEDKSVSPNHEVTLKCSTETSVFPMFPRYPRNRKFLTVPDPMPDNATGPTRHADLATVFPHDSSNAYDVDSDPDTQRCTVTHDLEFEHTDFRWSCMLSFPRSTSWEIEDHPVPMAVRTLRRYRHEFRERTSVPSHFVQFLGASRPDPSSDSATTTSSKVVLPDWSCMNLSSEQNHAEDLQKDSSVIKGPRVNLDTLPYELIANIACKLRRADQESLRLTCQSIEQSMSWFFESVVAPFTNEFYGHKEGSEAEGVPMFERLGSSIKRFALAMEFDEKLLSFPLERVVRPPPSLRQSFWGDYRWPGPPRRRFKQLEKLEANAKNQHRMTAALSKLTAATSLGLCLNSGLGWLNGPDLFKGDTRKPKPTKVFGKFKSPATSSGDDAWFRRNVRKNLFPEAEEILENRWYVMFVEYAKILQIHNLATPFNLDMISTFMRTFNQIRCRKWSDVKLTELYWRFESRNYPNFSAAGSSNIPETDSLDQVSYLTLTNGPPLEQPTQDVQEERRIVGVERDANEPQMDSTKFREFVDGQMVRCRGGPWRVTWNSEHHSFWPPSTGGIRETDQSVWNGEDLDGSINWIQGATHVMHQKDRPDAYQFEPSHLTDLQTQMLFEYGLVQQELLRSFVICLVDNPRVMSHIRTLNLVNISSTYLASLDRYDLWRSLVTISELTLIVSPDWRVLDEDTVCVEDVAEQAIKPSMAATRIQILLERRILSHLSLEELHLGYVGGGENAVGMHSRNKHILPAPIYESHSTVLRFGNITKFTLVNCWATSRALRDLVQCNKFSTIKLDSFSLLAFDGRTLVKSVPPVADYEVQQPSGSALLYFGVRRNTDAMVEEYLREDRSWFSHLRPRVRGFEALGAPILKHTWSELLEMITPGKNVRDRCCELNMFPDRIAEEDIRLCNSPLQRLELNSVGYVVLPWQKLTEGYDHMHNSPDTAENLPWSRGHGFHVDRFHRLSEAMLLEGKKDKYLGRIMTTYIGTETCILVDVLGLKLTWDGSDRSMPMDNDDGCAPYGYGRYDGVLEREVDQSIEEEYKPPKWATQAQKTVSTTRDGNW